MNGAPRDPPAIDRRRRRLRGSTGRGPADPKVTAPARSSSGGAARPVTPAGLGLDRATRRYRVLARQCYRLDQAAFQVFSPISPVPPRWFRFWMSFAAASVLVP